MRVMRVHIEVINAAGIKRASAADEPMYFVTLGE
jgi:hypothetical protein